MRLTEWLAPRSPLRSRAHKVIELQACDAIACQKNLQSLSDVFLQPP